MKIELKFATLQTNYKSYSTPAAIVDDIYSLSDGGGYGPKLKLAFWYPVTQFSSDFHEIF